MKTLRWVLWGLVLVVSAAFAGVYVGKTLIAPSPELTASGLSAAFTRSRYEDAGGPFALLDTSGDTVTDQDLRGKPVAMFFGFTHCPDVCPTALLDASGWLDALGEDADKLQVVFVSVDPERDTPEKLDQYVSAFDERIMGLTARTPQEIREVAERYAITFEKVPLSNGSYTVNHTADTLLFDADGTFAGFIPYMAPNVRQNASIAERDRERTVEELRDLVNS